MELNFAEITKDTEIRVLSSSTPLPEPVYWTYDTDRTFIAASTRRDCPACDMNVAAFRAKLARAPLHRRYRDFGGARLQAAA